MAYWHGTVQHLSLTEVKAVTGFLWQVRRATSLSGFVAMVLQDLKALIPCDIVSYNEFHAAPPMINTTTLPKSVLPPESSAAVTRHYRDHPLLLHQLRTGDGSPRRITDMTSMRMFRRTALWSELYRPLRFRSEIALALPAPAGAACCVALDRDGRDFSERDLELLRLVQPYLSEMQRELDGAGRVQLLSQREREAVGLVADGKTNSEVAAVLGISPRTVQKHMQHVYDKLGVRRRAGAAVLSRLNVPAEDDGKTS